MLVLFFACISLLNITMSTYSDKNPSEANYDTANPPYIRKYLRTYGLTPPRAESYEVQKTRCTYTYVYLSTHSIISSEPC